MERKGRENVERKGRENMERRLRVKDYNSPFAPGYAPTVETQIHPSLFSDPSFLDLKIELNYRFFCLGENLLE